MIRMIYETADGTPRPPYGPDEFEASTSDLRLSDPLCNKRCDRSYLKGRTWVCTRLVGHEGDHVAGGDSDRVFARWTEEPDKEGATTQSVVHPSLLRTDEELHAALKDAVVKKCWPPEKLRRALIAITAILEE